MDYNTPRPGNRSYHQYVARPKYRFQEGSTSGRAASTFPSCSSPSLAPGRTGRLELTSHEVERRLFLEGGRIRFASSSSNDDRLGIYLLLRKRLTLADLKRVGPRVKPGVRLGTVLVEEGVLGSSELSEAILQQVRSIVLGLFDWTEAVYAFVDEPSRVDEDGHALGADSRASSSTASSGSRAGGGSFGDWARSTRASSPWPATRTAFALRISTARASSFSP